MAARTRSQQATQLEPRRRSDERLTTFRWRGGLRDLQPYVRLCSLALALTLALNLLEVLQPKLTEYAIDYNILPRQTDGLRLLVSLSWAAQILRSVFSYFQSVF